MLKRVIYGTLAALIIDAALLYALHRWDVSSGIDLSPHAYYAFGLGVFFTVMVGVAISALSFLSARLGMDDEAHDVIDNEDDDQT